MTGNLSIVDLVLSASFVVQIVLLLLLAASVASWSIIMRKRRVLRTAVSGSDAFESIFWTRGDLSVIYDEITSRGQAPADMAGVFEAGFRAFKRLRED